jgi:tRNA threonylcarbamoyladenosine biosynthesis protein TsaB
VIILAVDTALGACSAALLSDGRVLAHEHREMARGHAEALAPMVEDVMRRAACAFSEVERIGVTTGPGTFAGQRVGLAFARALALALKKPAIGVTTLDVMAAEALSRADAPRWAAAAADAKRGEIYLGARTADASLLEPVLIPLSEAPSRLASFAGRNGPALVLAGTAAEALVPLLRSSGLAPTDSLIRQPDAIFVARLAAVAPEGPPPKPLYLRPPDAKLPGASS